MKITPSNDGKMRGELKVTFRVNLEDAVNAIVLQVTEEFEIHNAANKAMAVETALKYYSSRVKIITCVGKALRGHGLTLWARVEKCASEELLTEITKQARVLVLKKFPKLN